MEKINFTDEYIFYTLQGEGKYCGHPTIFVRFSGCNLRCSWRNPDGSVTQCDTPHSSFNPEKNLRSVQKAVDDIVKLAQEVRCTNICITGGEPYLQKNIKMLVGQLVGQGFFVSIETNGTVFVETSANFISLSPKLASSSCHPIRGNDHENRRLNYNALDAFLVNHDCQLKFVANTEEDIKEIETIVRRLSAVFGHKLDDKIWLMPQGINRSQFQEKSQWLFEVCKSKGWKYTDRLHIQVYGNKKGV